MGDDTAALRENCGFRVSHVFVYCVPMSLCGIQEIAALLLDVV